MSILDFFDVVKNNRSIRKYQDKMVETEKLERILEAARLAPSTMNRQPYQLFVITNKEILSKIESTCKQQWKAPLMIALVSSPKEAWVREDGEEYWKTDAAIAMNQVSLAAFVEGLGTCWIVEFKENAVKEILSVDSELRIPFLLSLGYPSDNKGAITNRKKIESLVRNV